MFQQSFLALFFFSSYPAEKTGVNKVEIALYSLPKVLEGGEKCFGKEYEFVGVSIGTVDTLGESTVSIGKGNYGNTGKAFGHLLFVFNRRL